LNKGKAKLIEGSVGATLVKLTMPMLLAVMTMVAFNQVDTYFVGQLGKLELAAMGFTLPVVALIASLAQGLGVGASAVIARAIGEGDSTRVQRLATDSLILSVVIVAAVTATGLFTIDPVFRMLGATDEVLPLIRDYMSIWYVALAVVVVPMVGNATIRATGDMVTPAAIMFVAVGINIVLDPLLIFGWGPIPGYGIRGAAFATLISRVVTLIAAMYVLIYREKMLTRVIPTVQQAFESWKSILYIGIPAGGTNMLVPVSTGIITGLVASYGNEAVAAYGVGSRIEFFALAVMMALSSTLTPFIAQNWGAGELGRVRRAATYAVQFAVAWGVIMAIILWIFSDGIGAIFNDDPAIIEIISLFLVLVPFSYALQGILMITASALNALNRPLHATVLMALRLFGLYVPLALIAQMMFGLNGIFGAAAIANILAGIASWFWLQRILNAEDAQVEARTLSVATVAAAPGD
jgi:putative MATE family efflux protein